MVTWATWAEVDDPQCALRPRRRDAPRARRRRFASAWTFRVVDDPTSRGEANMAPRSTSRAARSPGCATRPSSPACSATRSATCSPATLTTPSSSAPATSPSTPTTAIATTRFQADELAVLLTARAGYDPRAVETMLRALGAGDPPANQTTFIHRGASGSSACARSRCRCPPVATTSSRVRGEHQVLVIGDGSAHGHVVGSAIVLVRAASRSICRPARPRISPRATRSPRSHGAALIVKPITRSARQVHDARARARQADDHPRWPTRRRVIFAIVGPAPSDDARAASLPHAAPRRARAAAAAPHGSGGAAQAVAREGVLLSRSTAKTRKREMQTRGEPQSRASARWLSASHTSATGLVDLARASSWASLRAPL